MYAYLDGTFDLPAGKIQGPKDDENPRDWYEYYKEALKSQGWVPGEQSETKRDILLRVLRQTLRGTKQNPHPEFAPVLDRWTASSWEKQVSCLMTC
jgi:hypothetical protein